MRTQESLGHGLDTEVAHEADSTLENSQDHGGAAPSAETAGSRMVRESRIEE
jgi:hypothetical protein